jgi:hypothetical protein
MTGYSQAELAAIVPTPSFPLPAACSGVRGMKNREKRADGRRSAAHQPVFPGLYPALPAGEGGVPRGAGEVGGAMKGMSQTERLNSG